jgi:translation initiation factor IF-1
VGLAKFSFNATTCLATKQLMFKVAMEPLQNAKLVFEVQNQHQRSAKMDHKERVMVEITKLLLERTQKH